ncbi:SUKH-3 domain-containing protein [Streptomyces venezuelae]|uniref:SUKH-3 domain-containing protein n=1 Tax=Streptomyces venezuelae TaxID=54571 RepID=UPI00341701C4
MAGISEALPGGCRSEETDRVLRAAGWHPGRSVPTAEWERVLHERGGFAMHEAARRFLAEFGGLASEERGPGRTMARTGFRLDPLAAEWGDEIFGVLSEEAGAYLYPVGEADRRNTYLGIAPDGKVYAGMDSVTLLAETADVALEKLIEGIR